jgi:hypothetical protein
MIKNISICILLLISLITYGRSKCDTLGQSFIRTEIPPETELSFDEIENQLNSKININDFKTKSKLTPTLSFEINCKGETFNFKTKSIFDTLLINELINIFKNDFKWQPAYQDDKPVDFVMYINFNFNDDKIKILNDRKYYK